MGLTPKATNFFFWAILICWAFLGDLILKGEKFGSKQGEHEYLSKGSNFDSKGEKKKK